MREIVGKNSEKITFFVRMEQSSSFFEVQLHNKILHLCEVAVLMELEGLLVELPHILALRHLFQVLLKPHQLAILPTIVRQNGDSVLKLEDIRVRRVVH